MVFDEAHEIEDVASDYFGRQISSYRFDELARDAENTLRVLQIAAPQLAEVLEPDARARRTFFETFPEREGRFPFEQAERSAFLRAELANGTRSLASAVKASGDGTLGAFTEAGRSD